MDKNELTKKQEELKKILFEDNDRKVYKEWNKTERTETKKPVFTYLMLSTTLLICLVFSSFLIFDSTNRINETYEIINAILIFLISISYVISFPKNRSQKSGSTILTSVLIILTLLFNGLYLTGVIKLPTQKYLPDFYNKSLTEVIKWTETNKIDHQEIYEYSDNVKKYYVINQTVKAKTLLKHFKKVEFTISKGPDYTKEVILPDMTNLTTDDVLKFVEENFLSNVQINFEESAVKNNLIIHQSTTGKIKRSDSIIFTASLGDASTLTSIKLKDLKNEKLLNAEVYLGKHGIVYELKYEFSDTIERGNIIKSNPTKYTKINPKDKVTLTVSKGKEIKIPELKNKTYEEVTKWIIENNLEMEYSDKYDNEIKKGLVISSNYKTGDTVEEGTKINITFSKGKLTMPKFADLNSFKTWATTYSIKYEVKEEFNEEIPIDNIIKFSANENEVIDPETTITVYISKGKAITTPDFIGKTKNEIQKECNNLGITCTFTNTKSNKTEGTAISQSIAKGTEISKNQTINIEIATKQTTSNTQNNNSNSGSSNNTTPSPSTPSKTFENIFIQSAWIQSSDPRTNCGNIKSGIQNQTSNKVNIICQYRSSTEGRAKGKIHEDSNYQANRSYSFTENKTYTFIIVE